MADLAYCANLGTIDFHPWPVRADDLEHPDELRIDLDPQPGSASTHAREVAFVARDVLGELGMTGFLKTSGSRGIHIDVRIEPHWDFTGVRHAAIALAREVERREPGLVDDRLVEGGARRTRLHRLQPERPRPYDRQRLLGARPARTRPSPRR